ncbi:MAG: hypothetical protein ACRD2I_12940 [Vicinamibacterales bacterium]
MTGTSLICGRDARSALAAPLTIAARHHHPAETIARAWFEGKAEHTIRSYQHDLEDFALFFSRALAITPVMSTTDALNRLFKQSAPSAHEIVLGFGIISPARTWRRRPSAGIWRRYARCPSWDGCSG